MIQVRTASGMVYYDGRTRTEFDEAMQQTLSNFEAGASGPLMDLTAPDYGARVSVNALQVESVVSGPYTARRSSDGT